MKRMKTLDELVQLAFNEQGVCEQGLSMADYKAIEWEGVQNPPNNEPWDRFNALSQEEQERLKRFASYAAGLVRLIARALLEEGNAKDSIDLASSAPCLAFDLMSNFIKGEPPTAGTLMRIANRLR